jgi:hypothetical protein
MIRGLSYGKISKDSRFWHQVEGNDIGSQGLIRIRRLQLGQSGGPTRASSSGSCRSISRCPAPTCLVSMLAHSERDAIDGCSSLVSLLHNSATILANAKQGGVAESATISVFPTSSPRGSPSPLSDDLQRSVGKLLSGLSRDVSRESETAALRHAYPKLIP